MGSQGADIWLSRLAREYFPFAAECKNVEKINIWKSWEQAKSHSEIEQLPPLVVFSRNKSEILVTLSLEQFLKELQLAARI